MLRLLSILCLVIVSASAQAQTFEIAAIFPDGTTWMDTARKGAS